MYLTLKRNWLLILTTILVIAIPLIFFGNFRVIAYTVSSDLHAQDVSDSLITAYTYGDENEIELFDLSLVHTIEIDMDPEDHDSMLLTYKETGEKEYFPADITIDGILIENVGIRLKGNSTLSMSLGVEMGPPGMQMQKQEMKPGIEPEYSIPYLIKFNEYVSGQNYQGYSEIALRNNFKDPGYLNEILGYELLAELGITAPSSVYSGISLNNEAEVLYVITEVINDDFVEEHFSDLGDLIKASPGSSLIYTSDDPTNYGGFELKTNENISDLNDLIELIQFINQSTDSEFTEQIGDYVDMDSLLRYLVFCNATVNMDSFPKNSNNYYLYQDSTSEQFTLIPWDLNEIFGQFWHYGGEPPKLDIFYETEEKTSPQMQMQKFPQEKPHKAENPFTDRILENEEFKAAYLELYIEFFEEFFTEEYLFARIDELAKLVLEANTERNFLENTDAYKQGIKITKQFIAQRIEFLEQELYNTED